MFAVVLSDFDADMYVVEKPYDMTDLSFAQTLVEGLISLVRLPDHDEYLDMYVNDEGLFYESFFKNVLASAMAHQLLVGPAVLIRSTPAGDMCSIDDEDLVEWGLADDKRLSLFEYLEIRKKGLAELEVVTNVNRL